MKHLLTEFGAISLPYYASDARTVVARAGALGAYAFRGPWTVASHAHYRKYECVPNLSRQRQHRILVALGRAIRAVRTQKGISQEKLALLAEVDRSYVGRVERGDNNVAILTLARLAAALEISLAKLLQKARL